MKNLKEVMDESGETENTTAMQDIRTDFDSHFGSSVSRENGGVVGSGQNNASNQWLMSTRSPPVCQNNHAKRQSYRSPRRLSSSRPTQVNNFDQNVGPSASPLFGGTVFPNPNRSIFTSGQPTSSLSVNTAHASMSPPPPARESRPLAALTVPGASLNRRPTPQVLQPSIISLHNSTEASVEKDADDPTVSMDEYSSSRKAPRTSMALSQLFTEDLDSSAVSRHGSYLRTLSGTQFTRTHPHDTSGLGPHVYSQGLINGKFSDITVNAFGTSYKLHRLLLDRAPFFSTAFSGPWLEADSKEMQLDPSDVDLNITQAAFELALKRIYGCEDPEEEYQEAMGLFAVACWLEMDDLMEASIENLLHQMTPSKLSVYIRFVTGNYYGAAGGRILTSAKAMLCRDGWQMKLRHWDGIPADIVREIIGGDGLFVSGEWERWILATRMLNRRLKLLAHDAGLSDNAGNVRQVSKNLYTSAPRYGTISHMEPDPTKPWQAFYVDQEIEPLLRLLDEGINYVHLNFEELQHIRYGRDVLGMPIIPEKVISSALWMQMELRQRIVNAGESDLELGLAQSTPSTDAILTEATQDLQISGQCAESSSNSKSNSELDDVHQKPEDKASRNLKDETPEDGSKSQAAVSTDQHKSQRKLECEDARRFWIPTVDATFAVGENDSSASGYSQASRGSRSSLARPDDVHWTGDVTSLADAAAENIIEHSRSHQHPSRSPATPKVSTFPGPRTAYTKFPPFRFSVEFPAAASLKENKRLYSNTVWYAGSLWNVYIQKKDSTKGMQLGVYLHREKQSENMEALLANYSMGHSVDERIGRLEREFEARKRNDKKGIRDEDNDHTTADTHSDVEIAGGTLSRSARRPPKLPSQTKQYASFPRNYEAEPGESDEADNFQDSDDEVSGLSASYISSLNRSKMPTLPPYIDGRPTIQTYFKIYTPSKDGRVLTVYESKPDRFNFSQSWGWKSSSLELEGNIGSNSTKATKDKRLRFMFVLGTV